MEVLFKEVLLKLPIVAGIILATTNIFAVIRSDEFLKRVHGLENESGRFEHARRLPVLRIVLAIFCLGVLITLLYTVELSKSLVLSAVEREHVYYVYVLVVASHGFIFLAAGLVGVGAYFAFQRTIAEFVERHKSTYLTLGINVVALALLAIGLWAQFYFTTS